MQQSIKESKTREMAYVKSAKPTSRPRFRILKHTPPEAPVSYCASNAMIFMDYDNIDTGMASDVCIQVNNQTRVVG